MSNTQAIKILADMELEATLFAQKCSKARRLLEKVEGTSPAPKRGGALSQAQIIDITSKRRKHLLRNAQNKKATAVTVAQ